MADDTTEATEDAEPERYVRKYIVWHDDMRRQIREPYEVAEGEPKFIGVGMMTLKAGPFRQHVEYFFPLDFDTIEAAFVNMDEVHKTEGPLAKEEMLKSMGLDEASKNKPPVPAILGAQGQVMNDPNKPR